MEITSDVSLIGKDWELALESYSTIFKQRPNYEIFMLSLGLGILKDKTIESSNIEKNDFLASVPRTVLQNRATEIIDIFFQSAILTTTTVKYDEKKRLELAFGEDEEFNKLSFLTGFANYGVHLLNQQIGATDLITVENLKDYLIDEVEANSLSLNMMSDEILLDE